MVEIRVWKTPDQFDLMEFSNLMTQLCPNCESVTFDHLYSLINNPYVKLMIASDSNHVIGSLTLAWYPIPTSTRAWIEDVVVDKNYRGKKIGEALVLYAVDEAKRLGIKQVDLTSRPDRIEANILYQKLGFQKRETNAYRLHLDSITS